MSTNSPRLDAGSFGRGQPRKAVLTLVLLGLIGTACSDSGTSDPGALKVGYYTKDSFEDLSLVRNCPVLWGLQGGNWTMPTLRVQNFSRDVQAWGSLTLGAETLGTASLQSELLDRGDGWFELTYLPIPVSHPAPNEALPIDDLYGQNGELSFSIVDDSGRFLEANYAVTLLQSEVTE